MSVAGKAAVPPNAASPSASATARPPAPTVLAFDFGEKYIGVAVGDSETGLASPLTLIEGEDKATRFSRIASLIAEWGPGRIVVGLPLGMDGTEHDLTRRARRFARQLEGRFGIAVAFADERLSSSAAGEALRGMGRGGRAHKHDSHALAAQIVLQAFLDEQRRAARLAARKAQA
jgi:putative Holliday junction resolvase